MLNLAQHPSTFGECATLFFALLIGHAFADYPLQGDFLALHKTRTYRDPARQLPEGLWVHCLFAHGLIHAGFVWCITGRVFFGFTELVVHMILDFVKSEKRTGYHTDQLLHVTSKALYVLAIQQAWVA
jgi:hypothetical protein